MYHVTRNASSSLHTCHIEWTLQKSSHIYFALDYTYVESDLIVINHLSVFKLKNTRNSFINLYVRIDNYLTAQ